MSFDNYGGLTSQTGSVGGGGDGNRHDDDRGIFFPEFDEWARINKAILKRDTRSSQTNRGIEETITIDIDFNDGAWRPSSTILANSELPKKGDEHPTIAGCRLDNVSITNVNNQPDHFRATLKYKYPEKEGEGGSSSSGGGTGGGTPLDEPFLITFTPVITRIPISEDLDGKAIVNINGEPYDLKENRVRLDGICKWNQFDWDQTETEEWTNIINKGTWEVGDYKFGSETVLLNYVIGNLKFYTDERGKRIKYYSMEAGISIDNGGWGQGDGVIGLRSQGTFYYPAPDSPIKMPRDRSGRQQFDLDAFGGLLSENESEPVVTPPDLPNYDYFNIYEAKTFKFVDI